MPRGIDRINDVSVEVRKRPRMRRRKKQALHVETFAEPVIAPAPGYHPRPAKSALRGLSLEYEPPYESAAMPIGQRSEHPEYDIGHMLERPVDLGQEEEAA